MHIKHFKRVPLADLDLVMPERTTFVPPVVVVQLVVTLVLALLAVVGALFQVRVLKREKGTVCYSMVGDGAVPLHWCWRCWWWLARCSRCGG